MLIADGFDEAKEMLNELKSASKKVRLNINIIKTSRIFVTILKSRNTIGDGESNI